MNQILAIAIYEYDDSHIHNLSNCKSDIELVIKTLTDKYQFDDVKFISGKQQTTGKNLYATINNNLVNAIEDDSILLLFAGHGQYNQILGTSYWQPSDATYDNPNSWFNMTELVSMIRVSKAKHISIIADSCFSGAIFEPHERGGGMTALESKKSRIALTSGSIETVSDGVPGLSSPFTQILVQQLIDNKLSELPFITLAGDVLINFTPERKQTPKYGSLTNVGHDGGSFIFKLRNELNSNASTKENLNRLVKILSDIHILHSSYESIYMNNLQKIILQKNEVIKSQEYEKAAALRHQEKQTYDLLVETLEARMESFYEKGVSLQKKENLAELIDEEYEKYIYSRKKAEELYEEIKSGPSITKEDDIFNTFIVSPSFLGEIKAEAALAKLAEIDNKIVLGRVNPNALLWNECQQEFINSLETGLFNVLELFGYKTGGASNDQLLNKKKTIIRIISDFHKLQLKLELKAQEESFDDIVQRKNLEVEILNRLQIYLTNCEKCATLNPTKARFHAFAESLLPGCRSSLLPDLPSRDKTGTLLLKICAGPGPIVRTLRATSPCRNRVPPVHSVPAIPLFFVRCRH